VSSVVQNNVKEHTPTETPESKLPGTDLRYYQVSTQQPEMEEGEL
jgi:hypothetical protein